MKFADIVAILYYFVFIPGSIGAILGALGYGVTQTVVTGILLGVSGFIAGIIMALIPIFMMYGKPNNETEKKD
jgi:uncharacterized membrane protein (DUF485 family)